MVREGITSLCVGSSFWYTLARSDLKVSRQKLVFLFQRKGERPEKREGRSRRRRRTEHLLQSMFTRLVQPDQPLCFSPILSLSVSLSLFLSVSLFLSLSLCCVYFILTLFSFSEFLLPHRTRGKKERKRERRKKERENGERKKG